MQHKVRLIEKLTAAIEMLLTIVVALVVFISWITDTKEK